MNKIRILIVDDHTVVREGIKSLLSDINDVLVVGEAANGLEAIEQTRKLSPDIVIMDISMPVLSGIEAIKKINIQFPAVATLVLTVHQEEEYIEQIFKAGANGCIYKSAGKEEFEMAIRTIRNGENYFCSGITTTLMRSHFEKKEEESKGQRYFLNKSILTYRELEVLKLIATELSNKEIASQLSISVRTVETHRKNMMKKLNANSTIALIKYAAQEGIIPVKS